LRCTLALQSSFCAHRKSEERKRLVKKSLHNPEDFKEIIKEFQTERKFAKKMGKNECLSDDEAL
jgi:hypothetical protein